jgi:enoyl-CoA hydratase/carnithine racemase
MDKTFETITVERPAKHLMLVTLNRPDRANAFNTRMAEELIAVWRDLSAATDEVRVVVLTGAGGRAFCAGADLKERQGMSEDDWRHQHEKFETMAAAIMTSPVPVIAAVNGAAMGGGLELALACDFAYAVPHARFAFTEVTLGIIPGIGGTQNLPRAAGLRRAKELLMTGRAFTGEEALEWGIVNRLCEPAELLADALKTAERIAANAPLAVAAARRATSEGQGKPLAAALALELDCYNALVDTEDRHEGIAAFNEKRAPRFKGR